MMEVATISQLVDLSMFFFVQDFCSLTAGEGVAEVYYSEAF